MHNSLKLSLYGIGFGFAAIWLIPFVWVIRTAFLPKEAAIGSGWTSEWTFNNIVHVWNGAPFGQFMLNTVFVTGGVLVVQLITLTMAAYAFARIRFVGRNLLFMLFLVQIMVPPDALIFSNYQVLNEMGLLDTKVGIMLPYFASAFGVFLLRQSFKQLPYELEEAARVEGASRLRILSTIYVPLSRPIYVSFAIVSVSFHWNDFLWPLIVTNSEENRLLTVGLAMFAKSTESGAQWSDVSAATLIVSAPIMIGFLLFQRQVIGSFMNSGIKG
ncbi:carbohydrate ABC transporter permease [Cohnella silvisoli]|uniref:Carbohydrate ABC transporter permease n=1 Tax=Cohnella silvisoli TaxID=2873699 RepID=A0ABV1KNM0_9BACL|nr:carbohydrate ABC transporter permease [Cohnella silvisoli]MCD9021037.1 carbohydrate ABC transporter permease [Cohnella silvisoli]